MVYEEMDLQEIFYLNLTQGKGHMKHCPLHHVTYVPVKFEVATINCEGDACITKKKHLTPRSRGQGHTKCCSVPSVDPNLGLLHNKVTHPCNKELIHFVQRM